MSETPRVVLAMIPFTGFDRGLLDGIARYIQVNGPWVSYLSGDYPDVPFPTPDSVGGVFDWPGRLWRENRRMPFPNLRQWRADGVIGRIQLPDIARHILAAGVPTIAVDLSDEQLAPENPLSTASEVRADSLQAGRLGAKHFIERGFRNFAFCGFAGRRWSRLRHEGFDAILRAAGFSCEIFEPPRNQSKKSDRRLLASWFKSLPKPVGLMACNDIRGRQIIEAAMTQGLAVPDDVAVLGADDDPLICRFTNPPLSSVAFNLEQAGYKAAELLDNLMAGRTKKQLQTPKPRRIAAEALWVVPRRSTDVIAVDDRHLSAALRFIRDNSQRPISVGDVTVQAGLSRRGLEIRFRDILHRSVRQEIERIRIARAKQLLAETAMPIERIAALTGFGSLQYLGAVFRQATGDTPARFRRKTTKTT